MTAAPAYTSVVELFEKSCEQFAPRDLFGVKRGGTWSWITYAQVKTWVDHARGGLASLGVGDGDRVAIIANNRVEWAVLAYASYGLGASFVPMYEAQHPEEWQFVLNDAGAKVVVCATKAIKEKVEKFREQLPALQNLVVLEGGADVDGSYEALLAKGERTPVSSKRPTADAVCTLIYTSGTTGVPKGVILTHSNIASNVAGLQTLWPFAQSDRTLSFLPWAHSFGFTCELNTIISVGAQLALNTAVDKLMDELAEVQPTMLISVPRIFNRVYDRVNAQMSDRPAILQRLFRRGLAVRSKQRDGKAISLTDKMAVALAERLIFSKIRGRLGGRLKYAASGGAALAREVAEFIDNIGILVFEGYGLTETSPVATANSPRFRRIGSVGKPLPGVTISIEKSASDDVGRGEVIVRGPNVMRGYYHRDDETKAVLLPDGGFRTGDMGYVDDDGFLFITGRIKEQYKLENGKYVVPTPLEEQLKLSPLIANVMVYGDNKPFNVALIVPDAGAVQRFAREAAITGSYEELVKHASVKQKIEQEVARIGESFRAFDKVKKVAVIGEDFTTENDMLTPSLKLKRRNVMKKWGRVLEELYSLDTFALNEPAQRAAPEAVA